jgi:hypothetical protein
MSRLGPAVSGDRGREDRGREDRGREDRGRGGQEREDRSEAPLVAVVPMKRGGQTPTVTGNPPRTRLEPAKKSWTR